MQLCSEIEKKAVLVREQQGEYDRVQAAYAQMTAALENAAHEKRHSEALILDLEAQIRQDDKQVLYVFCFHLGLQVKVQRLLLHRCNADNEEIQHFAFARHVSALKYLELSNIVTRDIDALP